MVYDFIICPECVGSETLNLSITCYVFLFQIKMATEATRKFIENYRADDYQDDFFILGN